MTHLHETTDTDNSEFRPAIAACDGVEHTNWHVPGSFYLVGKTEVEVYPYSPKANPESCIEAQVATVMGTPDYLLESGGHKAPNP